MVALSFLHNIIRGIGEECYRSGRKSVHLNEKFHSRYLIINPHPDFRLHLHTYDYRKNK
jgi:tRNA U38,U39,U40 pseudouridine synthase TruA